MIRRLVAGESLQDWIYIMASCVLLLFKEDCVCASCIILGWQRTSEWKIVDLENVYFFRT